MNAHLQPQAVPLEEAIIGALMLEKDTYQIVSEILTAESFYVDANRIIFSAIERLAKKNAPIDILTVTEELIKSRELDAVGGAYHITSLTDRVGSAANIEFHARIVAQKYIARQLILSSSKTINSAYSPESDVFDILGTLKDDISNIEKSLHSNKLRKTSEIVSNVLDTIANAKANGGKIGPSTGLRDLDAVLRGIRTSCIYVIAGATSMGKTAAVNGIAKSLCIDQNLPIGIFSLEMTAEQLLLRTISDLSEIDSNKLASGDLNEFQENKLKEVSAKITDNFHIDDTPSITIQYFESQVRKLVEVGVRYFMIDYIQLMELLEKDMKGRNREQQVAFITRNLKRIAKKYDIAIFELAQVSREMEKRTSPRPQLSDLRESGSIEQDADIVILLYRPEYYNIKTVGKSQRSSEGLAEIIIAKHRGGPTQGVLVKYIGYLTRFEDLEKETKEGMEGIEPVVPPTF